MSGEAEDHIDIDVGASEFIGASDGDAVIGNEDGEMLMDVDTDGIVMPLDDTAALSGGGLFDLGEDVASDHLQVNPEG